MKLKETKAFSGGALRGVRDRYMAHLNEGLSGSEAREALFREFKSAMEKSEGRRQFCLALAEAQWESGTLEEAVKSEAIRIIDASAEAAAAREREMERLKDRLMSPPLRDASATPAEEAEFAEGDVLSYELPSGKRAILRVVGLYSQTGDPIFEVCEWNGKGAPDGKRAAELPFMRFKWLHIGEGGEESCQFMLAPLGHQGPLRGKIELVARGSKPSQKENAPLVFLRSQLDEKLKFNYGMR